MNEQLVEDLLVEWEIARQQGREMSPDELAADQPQLREELHQRIAALKATSWMIDDTIDQEPWTGRDAGLSTGSSGNSFAHVFSDLSTAEFIEAIVRSEVLNHSEVTWLQRLLLEHGAHLEPCELADRLVEEQVLTFYQATALLSRKKVPLVLDRYVVLDTLGAGGMGLVYKAMHRSMERVVALKMLPQHAIDSPTKVSRFRREIKVAAQLSHPNIVAAYDAHESQGMHFLVMEYVAGEDLKKTVLENGPLSVADATNIVFQIASALAEAHRQEIVHRDVKPSNILLSSDGVPKLLDLGLARIKATVAQESSNELTREGLAMGTAAYMAPEQAINPLEVDSRADIYSLGCTLYFLIEGQPLFDRTSSLEILRAHRDDPTPRLRDANPAVTDDLERVFQKMVAKNRADRYASMQQVCDALIANRLVDEQLAAGLGEACLSSEPAPATSTAKRRRRAMYVAASIAVVCLGVVLLRSFLPAAADRQAAVWVLSHDGRVTAETAFGTQRLDQPSELPADEFRVVGLELVDPGQAVALDSVLALPKLKSLILRDFARDRVPFTAISQLRRLSHLGIVASHLRDGDLSLLAEMTQLESLDLSRNELTDAALAGLEPFSDLERLDLSGTAIEDRGLQQLQDFRGLRWLAVQGCTISDRGVAALAELPGLETLLLNDTGIGDDSLALLAGLERLGRLEIAGTEISPAGLAQLGRLSALSHLRIQVAGVSGEWLGSLGSLTALDTLELQTRPLTDGEVRRLGSLQQLKRLHLIGAEVPPAVLQRLAASLPACEITAD